MRKAKGAAVGKANVLCVYLVYATCHNYLTKWWKRLLKYYENWESKAARERKKMYIKTIW